MKRVKEIVLTLAICISLTGCGFQYFNPLNWPDLFTNAVEQMQNTSASNSLKDTIAKNSIFPQSKKTAEAGNAAMVARDAADNSLKFNEKLRTVPFLGGVLGWGHGFWADHKVAQASRKENSYYTAVAGDSVLQSAIKNAEGKTRVRGFSLDQIPTWLLMVIIVLIVIIILMLLKRLLQGTPKEAPAPQPQPVVQQTVVPSAEQQTNVSELKTLDLSKKDRVGTEEGQMKYLKKQCAKKGLDVDKVLAKFDNDVFAANEYVLSTPAEQLEELK